jgi:hypothetical protein
MKSRLGSRGVLRCHRPNIQMLKTGAGGADQGDATLPASDLERWPVPVKSCRQAVPGLSWVDAGDSHGKAVRCGG